MCDKLKWTRQVPFLINYYIVMNVLFAILIGGAGLSAFLVFIKSASEIFIILRMVTLVTGTIIVLSFILLGILMMKDVMVTFILTENCIKSVLNEEVWPTRVFLFFRFFTKPRLMSESSSVISGGQTSVEWGDVRKAVMDERKKVISLSSERRLLIRLYCSSEVYLEAVEYVKRKLPDVESKYI